MPNKSNYSINSHLRQTVGLQEAGAARKAVAVRAPVLAVARLAVHVLVGPIARDNRVQRLCAVFALVALAMPLASLGQHLLGGVHDAAAARTTLAGWRLDLARVHDARPGRQVTA